VLITLSVRHFSETSLKQSVRELATEEGESRQEPGVQAPAMKNFDFCQAFVAGLGFYLLNSCNF
jgi:hypothetical protein